MNSPDRKAEIAGSPLRIPSARNLLIARAVSAAGTWIQISAASWYVLDKTGSATAVGVLAAITFGPRLFGSAVGGWLADRHDLRRLGSLLSLIQAVAPLLIAILMWNNELPIALLYVLMLLAAIPGALSSPIVSSLEPLSVPAQMRPAMIADTAVAYSTARICGPLIGSALVIFFGVGGAFLANSLSFVFNAVIIRRTVLASEPVKVAPTEQTSYRAGIKEGWGHTAARTAILTVLIFFGVVAPIQQLMPSIARTHATSIVYVGILLSSMALGNIFANPFIRRALRAHRSFRFLMAVGLIASGPILVLLGLNSTLGIDIVLLVLLGAAWECVWVGARTSIQLELPAHVTGRMLGLFYSALTLGIAAGSVLVGALFEYVGTRTSLVLLGVAVLGYGLFSALRLRSDNGIDSDSG